MLKHSPLRTILPILAWGVLGALSGAVFTSDLNAPVSAAQPAYGLESFQISYPYDHPREDTGPDPSLAEVSFIARWASGTYPGNVDCEVFLRDISGAEVGRLPFELDNATDGSRAPAMTVRVSGPPTTADGICGSSQYRAGPGYVFTGPISKSHSDAQGKAGGTRLTFSVAWEHGDKVRPGMRTCYLRVTRKDGSQDPARRLDVVLGEGEKDLIVPGEPESIRTARVDCGPLSEE